MVGHKTKSVLGYSGRGFHVGSCLGEQDLAIKMGAFVGQGSGQG
ncbi:hypothetical protein ACMX1E_01875 [Bartonella bacilliformis]|nr:hypothetical protein [Bartonella bacilliformis]EYS94140.1 hypothetical protein X470_01143 [Bartonella bacilliformis Peru-18]KEG18161.1 hypothetical protein H709_00201 [Bartonella bacilliformis CUSCO5]